MAASVISNCGRPQAVEVEMCELTFLCTCRDIS